MEEAEWWAQDTAEGRSLHRQLQNALTRFPPAFYGVVIISARANPCWPVTFTQAPLCFPNKSEAPNSGHPVPKARHPKAHLSQATGRDRKRSTPKGKHKCTPASEASLKTTVMVFVCLL